MLVNQHIEGRVALTMKQDNASAVEKPLLQADSQKQKHVQDVAPYRCVKIKAIRKVGREPVYNMEVEDNHNFAVEGGLIVHNCMDAMRYFVKTKKIVKVKRETKSIFY